MHGGVTGTACEGLPMSIVSYATTLTSTWGESGDAEAVEKPYLGADVRPYAETAVRNPGSSATSIGVILSASLTERGEALFSAAPH